MRPDFDVVIVGGGYAGQAAARELVRNGFRGSVLVVDRRGRAGYPPSSTSGIATYWLDKLGFPPASDAVASPIRSFRMVVYGDRPETLRVLAPGSPLTPDMGVVLQEHSFLGRLERESAAAGVEFWHATHAETVRRITGTDLYAVEVRDPPRGYLSNVTCHWVLDAGGYDSRISRHFGITEALPPEDRHNGLEISVPNWGQHPQDRVTLYVGRWAPGGYAWVFPSTENGVPHLRVGIGTPLSVRDERGVPVAVRFFFDNFLKEFPEYGGVPHHRMGGVIPTYRPNHKLHRGRVLSLGDAARLCDPLTGGGIHQGLASGVAAAHAVAMTDPNRYERELAPFIREMRARYRWKQVVLGMTEDELRAVLDALAETELPPGRVSPYAVRRIALRNMRRRGFKPIRVLWRSGRLWKALAG